MTVTYTHDFQYVEAGGDHHLPGLLLSVQAPDGQAIEVDAFLDSGASHSLFNGEILPAIGLDVMAGPVKPYQGVMGPPLEARLHHVRLIHEQLGDFDLEVGFSTVRIARNLLGRDFFDRIQIGFREHHLMFFVEPTR